MSISQALQKEFPAQVRVRGNHDFRSGNVRLLVTRPALLMAEVHGDEPSRVYLSPDGQNEYGAFCTCTTFEKQDSCKHLWATLLEVDAKQLPWLQSATPGYLVPLGLADFLEQEVATLEAESTPLWQLQINRVNTMMQETAQAVRAVDRGEIVYVLDVDGAVDAGTPVLELCTRQRKTNGDWGQLKPFRVPPEELPQLPQPLDRQILGALRGSRSDEDRFFGLGMEATSSSYLLDANNAPLLIPMLCRTGRFFLRRNGELSGQPLSWEDGPAWLLGLRLSTEGDFCQVRGFLRREGNEQEMDLAEPELLLMYGQLFAQGRVAAFDSRGAFAWVNLLREEGLLRAPASAQEKLLEAILELPAQPLLDLPEPWQLRPAAEPRPCLLAQLDHRDGTARRRIGCRLVFEYEGLRIAGRDPRPILRRQGSSELLIRHREREEAALEQLLELGVRPAAGDEEGPFEAYVTPRRFPELVHELLAREWRVEADGKVYRPVSRFQLAVSSGADWFELRGDAEFDGETVPLPRLLTALRAGDKTVLLGDGSVGLLPEDWLKRCGLLANLGEQEDGHVRFDPSQAALLDSLLAALPEVGQDDHFASFRQRLQKFEGIEPRREPPTFRGTLREYQRAALGWFGFLRDFGFGGCLADDMGLGKTVQVLALLENRRRSRSTSGPSLVVVPRSLVFNWLREAARFTPKLSTLDYTGINREGLHLQIAEHDVVITTYGILRRDIQLFQEHTFDYLILDEAQAIKNSGSQSAKAARLLRGHHRLALSGTPIENHLGELWSLFEFLNPGMLGRSNSFRDLLGNGNGLEAESRELLARAVRPFILRRTKEQVAPDLPEKIEQTLYCDMKPRQRQLYQELRDYYRSSLLQKIDSQGMSRARMQVLEALLRLRQVACHPGLLSDEHQREASAKLELLVPQLIEVCEQGHRALVFSQFTRLLSIVRQALEQEGLAYEYLDGQTRDRQKRVENFQSPDGPPVFLISLKAGGLGLNLTAADYVFILDPWWNPAIEAQAIDRAHRIGQERHVFAYRLICRDTVEEKIVELQQQKRDLADAIISTDSGPLQELTREDLEALLS